MMPSKVVLEGHGLLRRHENALRAGISETMRGTAVVVLFQPTFFSCLDY